MEATVIAAIVTATGAVVAAGIAGWVALKKAQKEAERLGQESQAADEAIEEVGVRVAYETESFEATATFDETGSGEQVRKWLGVRSLQDTINLKIPCRFRFSIGAEAATPEARELPGSVLAVHFEESGRSVSETDLTIDGNIVIDGPIGPNTGYVAFYTKNHFQHTFCMTREEALEKYRNQEINLEYASSYVASRTKVLRRSVVFPESHASLTPPPQAIVFRGERGEIRDRVETERVARSLSNLDRSATLVVNGPLVGRRYAIAWSPPPRKTGGGNTVKT